MALYFVTVWPSASECTFFKYPPSWPERIKRLKMVAIIRMMFRNCFENESIRYILMMFRKCFENDSIRWLLYNCSSAK